MRGDALRVSIDVVLKPFSPLIHIIESSLRSKNFLEKFDRLYYAQPPIYWRSSKRVNSNSY